VSLLLLASFLAFATHVDSHESDEVMAALTSTSDASLLLTFLLQIRSSAALSGRRSSYGPSQDSRILGWVRARAGEEEARAGAVPGVHPPRGPLHRLGAPKRASSASSSRERSTASSWPESCSASTKKRADAVAAATRRRATETRSSTGAGLLPPREDPWPSSLQEGSASISRRR
jgi:hypothetical protein